MISFRKANIGDIGIIQEIAYETWPDTFGQLMPAELIDYMLALVYNDESLKIQMTEKKHQFVLVLKDDQPVGYTSYEVNYYGQPQLMVHKAYLLPSTQGAGIGTALFDMLSSTAVAHNNKKLRLKVFFKNLKAIRFYEKYGFEKTGTEEVSIGNNYIILDNVMEKQLV